jgi:hypothetical protein
VGIIGSKEDALHLKKWIGEYLKTELHLDLSEEKTLVTNAKERVRFLGYDIKRGDGRRILKVHTITGTRTKRTVTYQLVVQP